MRCECEGGCEICFRVPCSLIENASLLDTPRGVALEVIWVAQSEHVLYALPIHEDLAIYPRYERQKMLFPALFAYTHKWMRGMAKHFARSGKQCECEKKEW